MKKEIYIISYMWSWQYHFLWNVSNSFIDKEEILGNMDNIKDKFIEDLQRELRLMKKNWKNINNNIINHFRTMEDFKKNIKIFFNY